MNSIIFIGGSVCERERERVSVFVGKSVSVCGERNWERVSVCEFGLVGFYGISTIVGYSMPKPLYKYILNIYDLVWFGLVWFYGISTIVGYLMPNPLCTYILNIYDLVWMGFMAYQPL